MKEVKAYPADVVMKVILYGNEADFEGHRDYLIPFIEEESGQPRDWSCKESGKGRFVSLTFTVDVDSHETLERLYARLKGLEKVKMLL